MFAPMVKDVCLVGGGHSHVLLIRRWAMNPLPGVRLTLISSGARTPYSGMLPGLIAGHYSVDDIHVDLWNLCTWANVRFINSTVTGLDLDDRSVQFAERPAIKFDVLSLDTGSTPDLSVPGSREHVTPVKPVHNFHARWLKILNRLKTPDTPTLSIGVVGSGAGGFELVTAMRHALPATASRCVWFLRNAYPLQGRPERVGKLAIAAARRQGIEVITHCDISSVEHGKLLAADGRSFELDEILWCTAATGPAWPGASGLATDARGFVATNEFLQSASHPFVFATGDIGTQVRTPSAKAGVFAVRQAPFLDHNIRALVLNEAMREYSPQRDFLSLMATGGKRAIASRGPLAIEADWVWRWKDHIDQVFMRKFTQLPVMRMNPALNRLPDALRTQLNSDLSVTAMQCKGCAAKVGADVLERVIAGLDLQHHAGAESALSPAGDAAVFTTTAGKMVQSVDQINAIVDDPYLLGRIAALHALSDVFTLPVKPHSAQVIVTLPRAGDALTERDMSLLMTGIVDTLNEENCILLGGHTVQSNEMSVGVVINAVLDEQANVPTANPSKGDVLILTQAIGIGTLFAGLMQQKANGCDVDEALRLMQMSNRQAANLLRNSGASRMTDVTGFGLLGHLQRLVNELAIGASIRAKDVPLIAGVEAVSESGIVSSLWPQNRRVLDAMSISTAITQAQLSLLCDPQTGGGLLAVVPESNAQMCLNSLQEAGYTDARVVGTLIESSGVSVL